jgi:restriction system protein
LGIEDVDVVGRTGDGGIDVRGVLVVGDVVRIPMAIQAKRWRIGNNVGSGDVRNVRGSLDVSDRALIVTTSDFTPAARRDASMVGRVPVGLMKGDELVEQLVGFGIGVERTNHQILESAPIALAP